jgi:hypothetical protein
MNRRDSIGRQTFQFRKLPGLHIEAPKGVASQHQCGGDVQNVISAKALLRGVTVGEFLENDLDGGRINSRVMVVNSQIDFVEKSTFCSSGKFRSNSQLLGALPTYEDALLQSINDFQSMQPCDGKRVGAFDDQLLSGGPMSHVHKRVREEIRISVNHDSSPVIMREIRSDSSSVGGTKPLSRICFLNASWRALKAWACNTRSFAAGLSGVSTKLPPSRLRMVMRPSFRAAVSTDSGSRLSSRTVKVSRTAGALRLADFFAGGLVFMSDIMTDITMSIKNSFRRSRL